MAAVSIRNPHVYGRLALACLASAFLLLTVYGWFIPEPGPNELSRVDLTFALARQHSTSIDVYHHNTIDRALYGEHWYSDKPLGLSLLAAPLLWVLDRGLDLGDMGETRVSYVAHLLTLATVALPAALLAPLVALTAVRFGARPRGAVLSAAAMALGTALLPFATTFYAHATSAALGFAAFALAGGALVRGRPRVALGLAGLCAALAALVEYPVGLVGAVLLAWLLVRRAERWGLAAFAVGGGVGLLPLPLYNWVSFGAPWRLGYGFVSQAAFGGMSAGLFGITRPTLAALAEVTVGPAGLLTQSPWIGLAPIGWWLWVRRGGGGPALVVAAVPALFLLYNASYYLPMGGQSSGPRFLIPTLPFLALGLAFLPDIVWVALGPLALFSATQMIAIAAVEPKPGPGVADAFRAYWLPRLLIGDVALSWGELRWGLRGVDVLRPLGAPVAVGAAAGLAALAPRLQRGLAPAAIFLTVAAATWTVVAAPVGRGGVPAAFRLATTEAPERTVNVLYREGVELVGYTLPDQARPGEWLDVVLFWRAQVVEPENLAGSVNAVGRDGANLAGYDGPPVGAGFPTNMWRPGQLLRMPYRLRLDGQAVVPAALGIAVGLRGPGDIGPIAARDRSGNGIGPSPVVARLALRGATTAEPGPILGSFEGGLDLVGGQPPRQVAPGTVARGTLRWRARQRPERDATVFVQVLGSQGPIAQYDAQPLGGGYPTSLWPVGEIVDDPFTLAVPVDTPPGEYPIIAGLYVLPEVRRLAVGGGDHINLGVLRVGSG